MPLVLPGVVPEGDGSGHLCGVDWAAGIVRHRDEGDVRAAATRDAGLLRPCCPADDESVLDADVARGHHQVRVELVAQLSQVLPDGWDVSAACAWTPASSEGAVLHPDVVVHRDLARGGRLPAPPVLCVELAAGPPGRSALAYARYGVDHYWHLNTVDRSLEVCVRVGDEYRRCESVLVEAPLASSTDASSPALRPLDSPGHWWVDFGVGVVSLDLSRLELV